MSNSSNPADTAGQATEDAEPKKAPKSAPKAQPHPHDKFKYKTTSGLTVHNFVSRKQ